MWKSPEGRGSYGMTTTPDGNVWFVSLASSYLGQIDRKTGEVEGDQAASAERRHFAACGATARAISGSRNGIPAASPRYSPTTNQWHRYQIPGQERAHLYAVYVDNKDVVWVSNWADNKIWSFDPKTNEFTAVPDSKSGADVRQINGANGVVFLGKSGNASVMQINTGSQS